MFEQVGGGWAGLGSSNDLSILYLLLPYLLLIITWCSLLQPHWPSCFLSNTFLPEGLCTCGKCIITPPPHPAPFAQQGPLIHRCTCSDMFDMFFRQGRIRKGLLAPSFHSFTLCFHFFRALPNTFFSSHRGICIFFFLSCLLHKKVEINFMKHGQHNSVIVYFRD